MLDNSCVRIFIAQNNSATMGVLTCYILPRIGLGGYYGVIEDVNVVSNYRRHGVGSKLFNHIFKFLRKNKVNRCHLSVEITNYIALAFYESLVFISGEYGLHKEVE